MSKRWSKTEIAHLKRHAEDQTLEELAQRFHTDTDEVRAKMESLGLIAGAAGDDMNDVALGDFEKALELVHGGKWQKGAEALEKILAKSDTAELADRARQYLEICNQRIEGEPKIDDPYLAAVVAKNRGDVDGAAGMLAKQPVDKEEKLAYLAASLRALGGDDDGAIELLGKAIALEPKNRVQAFHDPDFRSLRENEAFRQLLDAPQA